MERLRDYVELIRKPNKDLVSDILLGVDINKNLIIKTKSKKTNPKTLQIVEKGWFVMNGMSIGRDKRIPIALLWEINPYALVNLEDITYLE